MNKSKVYVVRLNEEREKALERWLEEAFERDHQESFGEPVPEFDHSKNIPLICFVVNGRNILSCIALGRKGNFAGTNLRRLNPSLSRLRNIQNE